jgi:capsular polysaccharide transport system permease protein
MPPDAQPKKTVSPPEGPQTSKVHVLNSSQVQRHSHSAQKRRRVITAISFVLCVLIPLAVVTFYYLMIAVDRYAVVSKFAIRSPGASAQTDLMGIMSSVSGGTSTMTDSYMLVDFIESRDLVDRLEARLDLREIYGRHPDDFLMWLDSESSKEDVVEYLSRVISVYLDTSSQILTLEVQAFTPEDAQAVSAAILEISDNLVNEVSERARQDTMRSAEQEVARIEGLLDDHRRALAAFREQQQEINPAASATEQIALMGRLEGQLAAARTRMASLTGFLNENAPSVRILQSEITAMEQELEEQRTRLGTGSGSDPGTGTGLRSGAGALTGAADPSNTLTSRIGIYEDLAVDLEFLQQAYFTTLASREAARVEADRMQRYLAAFVKPSLPEKSIYPQRTQNILIFAGFAIMLWAVGVMMVYIIREHSH